MNHVHFEGAKELEKINIDFDNDFIRIFLDYLHIKEFEPGEKFRIHAHPNYEFHYIASGEGKIGLFDLNQLFAQEEIVKRSGFSNSKNVRHLIEYYLSSVKEKEMESNCVIHNVKQGDVFVNTPGQFHWQVSSEKDPIVEYAMRCSYEIVGGKEGSEGLAEDYKMIQKLLLCSNIDVVHDEFFVRKNFETIFEEAYCRKPGYIVKVKHMLQDLIISFARHYWDKKKVGYQAPNVDYNKKRMQMIEEYVVSHLQRYITIPELAQHVFMSERSLSRFIKKETGSTVHKYILSIRINKAIDLITNTPLKMSEVAYYTGFSSQFHLSKVCKEVTGKTPTSYRS